MCEFLLGVIVDLGTVEHVAPHIMTTSSGSASATGSRRIRRSRVRDAGRRRALAALRCRLFQFYRLAPAMKVETI
jgi:hypothetical protein